MAAIILPPLGSGAFAPPPYDIPVFCPPNLSNTRQTISVNPVVSVVGPAIVPRDGGYEVRLLVTSIDAGTFRVHFGPAGADSDPICYSGVSGQGERVIITPGTSVTVIVPPEPIGGPYPFYFERLTGIGLETFTSSPLVTVVPHLVRSRMLTYRQTLLRNWKTGYRTIEALEFPQT